MPRAQRCRHRRTSWRSTPSDAACVSFHTEITVRVYDHDIEILDTVGTLLRRHPRATHAGHFELQAADRIFNPSRETARLSGKVAKLGPHSTQLAHEIFARLGRPGQKAIYGLANLSRHYARADIEHACAAVLTLSQPSYQALKRILEHHAAQTPRVDKPTLQQTGAHIREIEHYRDFFEHAQPHAHDPESNTPTPKEIPR